MGGIVTNSVDSSVHTDKKQEQWSLRTHGKEQDVSDETLGGSPSTPTSGVKKG